MYGSVDVHTHRERERENREKRERRERGGREREKRERARASTTVAPLGGLVDRCLWRPHVYICATTEGAVRISRYILFMIVDVLFFNHKCDELKFRRPVWSNSFLRAEGTRTTLFDQSRLFIMNTITK